MIKRKTEKVVVVTGASAGVGRALCLEFARGGASVALLARNREALEAARAEVEALHARALVVPLDVADSRAVDAAADRIEAELGPIDVWVNNAMATVVGPIASIETAEVRRVTEVTYLGTVHGTHAALRHMQRRNRGTIVQVGSTLAYRSIPLQAPYCAAKAAIRGFTDSLRTELAHAHSRIHVTMVHLPAVNTPQFDWCRTHMQRQPRPVAPVFQPEVAARAIAWAASQRRREVFVSARTWLGVWINKRLPWLLDRYLGRTGFDSQYRDAAVREGRCDNLWQPVPGDHGAHGSFDAEAHAASPAMWWTRHRGALGIAAVAVGLLATTVIAARRLTNGTVRRPRV